MINILNSFLTTPGLRGRTPRTIFPVVFGGMIWFAGSIWNGVPILSANCAEISTGNKELFRAFSGDNCHNCHQ